MSTKIDRYNKRILEELQENGRLTNQELAERVGLSPSPCLRRVRTLEDDGIIDGYHALLNPAKLGLDLEVVLSISMDHHTPERFANFERIISDIPEVRECLMITGREADYLVKVLVSDMEHYQDLLLNRITKLDGVSGVHSSFVLRKIINHAQLPI